MQLGDASAGECTERSQLDKALNTLDNALNGLVDTIEAGGLDQLSAAEKISFWQRFEAFRNRLPLVDHKLIAEAQTSDLAGEYCFANLKMLLTRTLQLAPAEAAARVRAAAALGPHTSTDGSGWGRCCRVWPPRNATVWCRRSRCGLWSGPCKNCPVPN